MKLPYQTLRDSSLPHQVVFFTPGGTSRVLVSCNCRSAFNKKGHYYDPIGPVMTLEESRKLYNNPANHHKPFTEEDKATW